MEFPKPENIQSVIFDFDGTLYDTKGMASALLLANPKDAFTIGYERQVRRGLKGQDFYSRDSLEQTYFSILQDKTGLSEKKLKLWYYQRYMPSMISVTKTKFQMRGGANDALRVLKDRHIPYCIFSDYDYVEERLRALQFDSDLVSFCVQARSAMDFGCFKPATRPFREMCRNMAADPSHCLVVGDRDDTDGEGARQLGMYFIQIADAKRRVIDKAHPVVKWADFAAYMQNRF